MTVFVEPYAGFASTTLYHLGLKPPTGSYRGSKGRHAEFHSRLILGENGNGHGNGHSNGYVKPTPSRLIVADTNPIVREFWLAASLQVLPEVATEIENISTDFQSRDLWEVCGDWDKQTSIPVRAAWALLRLCGTHPGGGGFRGLNISRPNNTGFTPCEEELAKRVQDVASSGLEVVLMPCSCAVEAPVGSIVIVDPPYKNRLGYAGQARCRSKESLMLRWSETADVILLCGGRKNRFPDWMECQKVVFKAKSEWTTDEKIGVWRRIKAKTDPCGKAKR